LLPETIDGFPLGPATLGLRMYEELVAALDPASPRCCSRNTRNQARALASSASANACPGWKDGLALHQQLHRPRGARSDRSGRQERDDPPGVGLGNQFLIWGWNFQPVSGLVQIGSAKNLARLLQRARPSPATAPGAPPRLLFMPTTAWEAWLGAGALRRGL